MSTACRQLSAGRRQAVQPTRKPRTPRDERPVGQVGRVEELELLQNEVGRLRLARLLQLAVAVVRIRQVARGRKDGQRVPAAQGNRRQLMRRASSPHESRNAPHCRAAQQGKHHLCR